MTRNEEQHHRAQPGVYGGTSELQPRWVLGLIFGGALAALLCAVPGIVSPPESPTGHVAHTSGLLAGYAAAVMLVLMSRWPALEKGVGAVRLARWHGRGGPVLLLLALTHAVAATMIWAGGRGVPLTTATLEVLRMPGLLTATASTGLLVGIGLTCTPLVRGRMRYEWWHALHLSTYAAVALSFSHQLAGPDLAGKRPVQIVWSLLYSYAFFLVLRYRLITPLWQGFRHRLRVIHVTSEARDVVSIFVRGRNLHELAAQPGQFFGWRFLNRRTWHSAHPFSLSAPPHGDTVRLTIKALGEGSRHLQHIRPGTRVVTEGPYGAMTARRRTRRHVLLIAGGIGITPMRALFEAIHVPHGRLTLLYRASSPHDVVFRTELDEIARRRKARVYYLIGPSTRPANRMTTETLTQLVPDLHDHDIYLCASGRFAAAVRQALRDARVPRRQLHEEVYPF